MNGLNYTLLIVGLLGGALGQAFYLFALRIRRKEQGVIGWRYLIATAIVNILVSGLIVLIQLPYLANSALSVVFQIGFTGSLISAELQVVETIRRLSSKDASRDVFLLQSGTIGGGLVLNGFWPVYGVGCFGALLVEIFSLYERRGRRLSRSIQYWVITMLVVAASGGVAAIHGINNVSAVVTLQLGATAPLIIKRFRN